MKCYIFLLVAIVLTIAGVEGEMQEDVFKFDAVCRIDTKISEDEFKAFVKGEVKGEPKDALKCHIKCILEKQSHWKNNALDVASTKKYLQNHPDFKGHEEAIDKVVNDCKDKKGANECDTVYLVYKCVQDAKPKH